jgi:hypothetical protein
MTLCGQSLLGVWASMKICSVIWTLALCTTLMGAADTKIIMIGLIPVPYNSIPISYNLTRDRSATARTRATPAPTTTTATPAPIITTATIISMEEGQDEKMSLEVEQTDNKKITLDRLEDGKSATARTRTTTAPTTTTTATPATARTRATPVPTTTTTATPATKITTTTIISMEEGQDEKMSLEGKQRKKTTKDRKMTIYNLRDMVEDGIMLESKHRGQEETESRQRDMYRSIMTIGLFCALAAVITGLFAIMCCCTRSCCAKRETNIRSGTTKDRGTTTVGLNNSMETGSSSAIVAMEREPENVT